MSVRAVSFSCYTTADPEGCLHVSQHLGPLLVSEKMGGCCSLSLRVAAGQLLQQAAEGGGDANMDVWSDLLCK